jgi:hypothetical protein
MVGEIGKENMELMGSEECKPSECGYISIEKWNLVELHPQDEIIHIMGKRLDVYIYIPIGSMYAIYGNFYHQYTPNVSIYTIHGSYGI